MAMIQKHLLSADAFFHLLWKYNTEPGVRWDAGIVDMFKIARLEML